MDDQPAGLIELLNACSSIGVGAKSYAATAVQKIIDDKSIEVVEQTTVSFASGFSRYKKFNDKAWSHTDCSSMDIMEEGGISEVLTADHHFTQAGFIILN